MSLPTIVLTIGTTTYNDTQRAAVGIVLDSWGWDYDGDFEIEFHEEGVERANIRTPAFAGGTNVALSINGSTVAWGQISAAFPRFDEETNWIFSYQVRGPRYLANQLPVTATDGTGNVAYNLPPTDDDYIASNSGLALGDILSRALSLHSSALSAIGITTDSTTASQLAALTLVPYGPVYLRGRLWDAIADICRDWAKNIVPYIDGSGHVRFIDGLAGQSITINNEVDSLDPIGIGYTLEDCCTRVVVRGGPRVYPFYASASANLITKAWTSDQESAWTYNDFSNPSDAFDVGVVNNVSSATSVIVHSNNASLTLPANFWNGRQAWIYLYKSSGSAITFSEQKPVSANSALSAGSTYEIDLQLSLENAGSSAYDTYKIVGTTGSLASGSRVDVWRLYNVNDPGSLVKNHLVKKFPLPVAFTSFSGDASVQTQYPLAVVVGDMGRVFPAAFNIVPNTGQIRFNEPIVKIFNPMNALNSGVGIVAPTDVYVLLAYARGTLTATYPPDVSGVPQFAGEAYSLFGFQNTKYIDIEDWVYQGNQSQFDAYAQMIHASIKAPIYEATIPYKGYIASLFTPTAPSVTPGWFLTIDGLPMACAIRGYRMAFANGERGLLFRSEIRISSRRNPETGDRYYVHPTSLNQIGFNFLDSFDPNAMSSTNQAALIDGASDARISDDGQSTSPNLLSALDNYGGGGGYQAEASSDFAQTLENYDSGEGYQL